MLAYCHVEVAVGRFRRIWSCHPFQIFRIYNTIIQKMKEIQKSSSN